MARELTPLTLPSWISRWDVKAQKAELTGHTSIVVEAYEVSTFFAITKPLPDSLNTFKNMITHLATGMTAHGFDKVADARKCVSQFESSERMLVGYDNWNYIDTPSKLMLQRDWMRDVIVGIKNE